MTVQTPIEVGSRSIPGWAVGLTVLIFLVGGVYLAGNLSGQNPPILGAPSGSAGASGAPPDVAQQARQIIENKAQPSCTACHGAELTGGAGPDLHGVAGGPVTQDLQPLAADHPDDWLNLWIDGTSPEVADIDRKGMPQFGGQLSPDEIETIVEYLKTLQ